MAKPNALAEALRTEHTTSLLAAISADNDSIVSEILSYGLIQINALGEHDNKQLAPLHLASRLAAVHTMKTLLDAGASVSLADGDGWLCLHHLAASTAHPQYKVNALQLLQQAGADADAGISSSQQTPLHIAAQSASTDEEFFARLVLAAREATCDASGRTPLHSLALSGEEGPAGNANGEQSIALGDILLRYTSIDPRDRDADRRSAADLAHSRGLLQLSAWLRGAEARAERKRRRRCCGRGGRTCWVQPLIVLLFLAGAHACAFYYCLPVFTPAWPSITLASIGALATTFMLMTSFSNPGYLPKRTDEEPPQSTTTVEPLPPVPPQHEPPPQADSAESAVAAAVDAAVAAAASSTPAPPSPPPAANHPTAASTPSGSVRNRAASSGSSSRDFCYTCRAPKPLRAKHCRACDRCVLQFDHHCPWIGSCVGMGNRVPFYLFVSCMLLDTLALSAVAIAAIVLAGDDDSEEYGGVAAALATWLCDTLPPWWCEHTMWWLNSRHAFRGVLAGVCLALSLPLTSFWAYRTRNILANLTTNERHNIKRYPHFRQPSSSSSGTGTTGGFVIVNPFDRGMAGNCAHYFCAPCGWSMDWQDRQPDELQVVQVHVQQARSSPRSEGRAPLLEQAS